MDIYKIKEEIRKIKVELNIPTHLKNNKKYIKKIFVKAEKEIKKLLEIINTFNQKDMIVLKTKEELTNEYYYIRNTLLFYFKKPRTLRIKNKKNKTK